jgi:hypothetical protein
MTRRDALKGAVGLATLGVRPRSRRDRVAIIGGGAGGVAAAYFLAGSFDVDLFEARARIGGHCDSRVITHRGRRLTVDLGAQFFHPDTHPIYAAGGAGALRPRAPRRRRHGRGAREPVHLPDGRRAADLLVVASARDAAASGRLRAVHPARAAGGAVDAAVGDHRRGLDPQPPAAAGLQDGCSVSVDLGDDRVRAGRGAAHVGAVDPADVRAGVPANLLEMPTTFNSKIGLQGNLQRMLDRSPARLRHRARAGARRCTWAAGWFLQTPSGRQGPYRFVVLNAPPRAGHELLRPLPVFDDVTALLDVYRYFDSRLLVHTDPAYMQRDRRNWAAYNAGVRGRESEGSAWLGALPETGVHVFKSWATRRRADPKHILLERRFKHPLITRSTIKAARALRSHQGRHGLYFSGHYTTGMDLQESAVYSAMQVAGAIAPHSRRLASLNTRLSERGRAGISYDL